MRRFAGDAHLCRRVARHHRGARRPIRRAAVAERRLSDLRDPHGAPARGERRDPGRRVFVRAGAVGPRGAERRVSDRPRVPSVVAGLLLLGAAFAPALLGQAGQISYEAFTLPNGLRVIYSEDHSRWASSDLPNGLRVIYSEDHSTPIVSVDVWYNTGSRNERPGRSGFAHLFEHMMFEGSAHVKKGQHFQLISRAGGSENGSTAEDRTNYYETVPSNRLNLALWLEADRMRSLTITDENFHNQRETVKEERRLRVDNQPYSPAFIDGMTWPFDSAGCFAYAHTVIGSMDDLNAAQLPDVRAFFDTFYAPNNATLVVVGDFKPLELRRYVNQYFSEIPRHREPPPVRCTARLSPGIQRREVTDVHANLPAVLRIYRAHRRQIDLHGGHLAP